MQRCAAENSIGFLWILLDLYSIPMDSIGFLLASYGFYWNYFGFLWILLEFYWIPMDSIRILLDSIGFLLDSYGFY